MSIWKSVTHLISRIQRETLFIIAERTLLVIISLDFSGNFLFGLNCLPGKLVKTFLYFKVAITLTSRACLTTSRRWAGAVTTWAWCTSAPSGPGGSPWTAATRPSVWRSWWVGAAFIICFCNLITSENHRRECIIVKMGTVQRYSTTLVRGDAR